MWESTEGTDKRKYLLLKDVPSLLENKCDPRVVSRALCRLRLIFKLLLLFF